MKEIKKYQSEDGICFDTKEECIEHEKNNKIIKWLNDRIPKEVITALLTKLLTKYNITEK
jgi:hypothetical protein